MFRISDLIVKGGNVLPNAPQYRHNVVLYLLTLSLGVFLYQLLFSCQFSEWIVPKMDCLNRMFCIIRFVKMFHFHKNCFGEGSYGGEVICIADCR